MQKPAREQGLNTQVGGQALANAQASASEKTVKPGTQARAPANVRLDADERRNYSTSEVPGTVTPEEPAPTGEGACVPGIPRPRPARGSRRCEGARNE